ncbi:MAG: hypothetical protein M1118_13340 [Chloroflexi bacterium]|nr:hypothetical protein [Chloroflexota bacterium]
MAHAYSAIMTRDDVASLLHEAKLHIHACYWEHRFSSAWEAAPSSSQPSPTTQRGRCFGPDLDIQIYRESDGYRVIVATDLRLGRQWEASLELSGFDAEDVRYVLWGERQQDGQWRSSWPAQVACRYPVAGSPRHVAVRVTEYRDLRTATLQFIRYRELVGLEQGE